MYVEYLTLQRWWNVVRPALKAQAAGANASEACCYIFDAAPLALRLAQWLAQAEGLRLKKLDFQITDVHDAEGRSAFLQVLYKDAAQLQEMIVRSRDFQALSAGLPQGPSAKTFLEKSPIYAYDIYGPAKYGQLWHVLMMVHVAAWHGRTHTPKNPLCLYINDRPWLEQLQSWAQPKGVELKFLGPLHTGGGLWDTYAGKFAKLNRAVLKSLVQHKFFQLKHKFGLAKTAFYFAPDSPRLLAEYWGNLGLEQAHSQSDVFFIQPQGIQPQDVLMTFNLAVDPLDEKKYALLKSRQIAAVALSPQSCRLDPSLVPVYSGPQNSLGPGPIEQYQALRQYWRDFFQAFNIKLHSTWYKYELTHMAQADAIADVGGVSVCYQRAYEPNPSPQVTVAADIILGFSPNGYNIEKANRSRFSYHVAVGYIGDYRFALLRPHALKLRQQLLQAGAKNIIAYFDENTVTDGRWFLGNEFAQKNTHFWLEQILNNPQLGMVFKPKTPVSLRRRLGPVAQLLAQAEKTGRCLVVEGGSVQGSYPPALAALAADVAIHDCLSAGTAGLESALAGVPTLLADLEGWPSSPLYDLGPGVVFRNWPQMWQACQEYFQNPKAKPGFGSWAAGIDQLDPFRDGKAALRMSQFLKWLLEDLRQGKSREAAMADAVQRYVGMWGKDKVHSCN